MLTEREQQVLGLRSEGLTQTEIAERLGISQAAVSSFEKNAKRKITDAQEVILCAKQFSAVEDVL